MGVVFVVGGDAASGEGNVGDDVAVGVVDGGAATALGAVANPADGKMDIPQNHGLSIYLAGPQRQAGKKIRGKSGIKQDSPGKRFTFQEVSPSPPLPSVIYQGVMRKCITTPPIVL